MEALLLHTEVFKKGKMEPSSQHEDETTALHPQDDDEVEHSWPTVTEGGAAP
jgi:hypothetical protein